MTAMKPDDVQSVDSDLLDRPRYMCREWNPRKLKPHRISSVPNFKLLPTHRPLFKCRRCKFANERYHICLFCGWTSKDAEETFQSRIQRRTISAPYRLELFSLRRESTPVLQPELRKPVSSRLPLTPSVPTPRARDRLCIQRHRPVSVALDNSSFGNLSPFDGAPAPASTNSGNASGLRCPCAGDVVTATLPPSGASSSPLQLAAACDNHDVCHSRLGVHGRSVHLNEQVSRLSSDGVDRSSTSVDMNFTTKLPTAMTSSRSVASRVLADVSNRSESQRAYVSASSDATTVSSMSTLTSPATSRILRHKKRHSMLHLSAPPSSYPGTDLSSLTDNAVRPQSQPTSSSVHVQSTMPVPITSLSTSTHPSMTIPTTKIPTHYRSQSHPNVHLGHRDRPYYSAIRKNMASTTSIHDFSPSPSSWAAASRSTFSHTGSRPSSPAPIATSRLSSPVPWISPPLESEGHATWLFDSDSLATPTFSPPSHSPVPASSTASTPSKTMFHVPFRRNTAESSHSSFVGISTDTTPKARRNTVPAFSKKEETELRVALAREVGRVVVESDEGYVYREKRKMSIGSSEAVRFGVKKLKHGLKTFVKRTFP